MISMFLCLGDFFSYLFYSKQPREDDWWIHLNHTPLKEQKEWQEKRPQCRGFPFNFVEFLRTPFFKEQLRCLLLEYEHGKTKLLHMTWHPDWTNVIFGWFCYDLFLATRRNGHVVTFFYSRPKVKMRQN